MLSYRLSLGVSLLALVIPRAHVFLFAPVLVQCLLVYLEPLLHFLLWIVGWAMAMVWVCSYEDQLVLPCHH